MIYLILFIIFDFCFVIYMENPKHNENREIKRMLKNARFHESYPGLQRCSRYVMSGYYPPRR